MQMLHTINIFSVGNYVGECTVIFILKFEKIDRIFYKNLLQKYIVSKNVYII
jgi:hypothetical protein